MASDVWKIFFEGISCGWSSHQKWTKSCVYVNLCEGVRVEVGVAMTKDVGQLSLRPGIEEMSVRESCSWRPRRAESHAVRKQHVLTEGDGLAETRIRAERWIGIFECCFVLAMPHIHTGRVPKMSQTSPSYVLLSWVHCFIFSLFFPLVVVFLSFFYFCSTNKMANRPEIRNNTILTRRSNN